VILVPGGQIIITCRGNSIASAGASLTDSAYQLTVTSTTDPQVDVTFTKDNTPTRYVYVCLNGKAVPPLTER
jgi:hypothetical protein